MDTGPEKEKAALFSARTPNLGASHAILISASEPTDITVIQL